MLVDVRITDTGLNFEGGFLARTAGRWCGLALTLAAVPMLLTGCKSAAARTAVATASPQVVASVGQRLEMIPPPSKTQYLAVHTLSNWANPYLTVEESGVTLHVILATAQRQDEAVRVSDLPAALNALPESSWPYGRVVAVEEIRTEPAAARPAVRSNVEAALKTLGDLGVVAYEWNEGGLR